MVSQQRMLSASRANRSFYDGPQEGAAPPQDGSMPRETARDAAPAGKASGHKSPDKQHLARESDWAADFDAALEEDLADLM